MHALRPQQGVLLRGLGVLLQCTGSAITSEMQLLEANDPEGEWRVVTPRQPDVETEVSHRGDHLFILLRDAARPNSELLVAPVSDPSATRVRRPSVAAPVFHLQVAQTHPRSWCTWQGWLACQQLQELSMVEKTRVRQQESAQPRV